VGVYQYFPNVCAFCISATKVFCGVSSEEVAKDFSRDAATSTLRIDAMDYDVDESNATACF
jgi:hypothetical protein